MAKKKVNNEELHARMEKTIVYTTLIIALALISNLVVSFADYTQTYIKNFEFSVFLILCLVLIIVGLLIMAFKVYKFSKTF